MLIHNLKFVVLRAILPKQCYVDYLYSKQAQKRTDSAQNQGYQRKTFHSLKICHKY